MSKDDSGETVETYRTDKDGRRAATQTSRFARQLKRKTDAYRVVIHDADTGRIGYWSKRSVVNDRVLGMADEFDYEVNLVSATSIESWTGELKKAVEIEFVPSAEVSVDE